MTEPYFENTLRPMAELAVKKGGYLIPEIAYINRERTGWLFLLFRKTGWAIITIGSFINSLGYKKEKIYPRKALTESLKNMGFMR